MRADGLALRSQQDHRTSAQVHRKAAADVDRIKRAAERIRHMTEIYRERLEGVRRDK